MSTAILLLAYGAPESLDDLPAYLTDIRGGRSAPPPLIEEVARRYRLIGGKSPLLAITRRVAARLQERLAMPVYVGMRHWHPYIVETVLQIKQAGIQHIVALCMAPHYSAMSIGAYRTKLTQALDAETTVAFVESWHTQPDYLAGIAKNVQATLERFPPATQKRVKIIFTAHSLPAAILDKGDPYDAQVRETARLLAHQLNLSDDRWSVCYQSAPRVDISWLGPQIEQVVPQLAQSGETNLLVAPIGFVADHAEVLYDLDIGAQAIARAHGVRLERMPMLNDSPALIAALAELARAHINPTPRIEPAV